MKTMPGLRPASVPHRDFCDGYGYRRLSAKPWTEFLEPFFTTKDPGKGTGLGLQQRSNYQKSHSGFGECRAKWAKALSSRSTYWQWQGETQQAQEFELPLGQGEHSGGGWLKPIREVTKTSLETYQYTKISQPKMA